MRRLLELVGELRSLGKDRPAGAASGDGSASAGSGQPSAEEQQQSGVGSLNHEHFFAICEAIAAQHVGQQEQMKVDARSPVSKANTRQVTAEEKDHRTLIKEVTRLLSGDGAGLEALAADPAVIPLLGADALVDSSDRRSQAVGLGFLRVFLLRPDQFPDRNAITRNQKVLGAVGPGSSKQASRQSTLASALRSQASLKPE